MKKLLILCVLLLAALLSGCAAEPLQGQTTGNTPKAPTPQEETPASFEPVYTEPNAPTVAVDPADSMYCCKLVGDLLYMSKQLFGNNCSCLYMYYTAKVF